MRHIFLLKFGNYEVMVGDFSLETLFNSRSESIGKKMILDTNLPIIFTKYLNVSMTGFN